MELKCINDLPVEGTAACHIKNLFYKNGVKLQYVAIQPGSRVPEEGSKAHEQDEYCFFISGEIECGVEGPDGSVRITKPGECSYIPRGQKHYSINRSNTECIILAVMVD